MTATLTGSSIVDTAIGLRGDIESYSDEAERTRRLPDPLVRLLRENGFIGMAFPRERGGMGLDLVTALHVIEEISFADASAGWCTAIGSGSIGTLPLEEAAARARSTHRAHSSAASARREGERRPSKAASASAGVGRTPAAACTRTGCS